ncbi:hypothetical protein KY290_033503 [Solanum tuberosum]|uniref:Uncharacterized protein n=1 Tax=Solanum tuberosum TaxID=4113 RepID=A0ABQ7U114_SOLTU|nr:hypothetical protein KY289_032861 [Solanum tuberosum]KAH0647508.1 hypothetical protein KY285_032756 [Solanum tuberosum]KAH0740460.1 hypothetical protein KY290_033503 [Solanum tuberosum]
MPLLIDSGENTQTELIGTKHTDYAISLFINALNPELKDVVRRGKPYNFPQAYHLARLEESSFATQSKAIRGTNVGQIAKRHLYSIELEEVEREDINDDAEAILEEGEIEALLRDLIENCEISLQDLNGIKGYRTLRNSGYTTKKPINILIDYGSTHNFINEQAAKRIGCKKFKWLMQGSTFEDDFLILPIGSCDVVLGIQWLCKLGDIQMSFENLFMKFNYLGKQVTLQGTCPSFKIVGAKALTSLFEDNVQIFMIRVNNEKDDKNITFMKNDAGPEEIQGLIEQYRDLFNEPKKLPPYRGVFDHHIPLEENSNLVNSRPYRYSPIQKDVIEKMTKDMLSQGIIHYSCSPYA